MTGNLEPIGWAKMEALGLKRHFTKPLVGGCVRRRRRSWLRLVPDIARAQVFERLLQQPAG